MDFWRILLSSWCEEAINHIFNHFKTPEVKNYVELFNKKKLKIPDIQTYFTMPEIQRSGKIGYKLIFTAVDHGRIRITDSTTQQPFNRACDLEFEWHRDILLQYLWLGVFYRHFSENNKVYLQYCLPTPINELSQLIDEIECACDRREIGIILSTFAKKFIRNGKLIEQKTKIETDLLTWMFGRYEIFGKCKIQSTNFQDIANQFAQRNMNLFKLTS